MSAYSFNARNGLSVGVNPTLVVDNLGNITCGNLTVSGSISGGGLNLSSPSAIGSVTPNTGAFTNLSATGTVSGAGFTNLLSSYATTSSLSSYAPKASPTFTGAVTVPEATASTYAVQGSQLFGFRNKLINGNFDIWQRGTSFSATSVGYTADRWKIVYSDCTAGTLTNPYNNALTYSVTTSGAASNAVRIYQPMEYAEVIKLRGKTMTVSVQWRAENASTIQSLYLGFATTANLASFSNWDLGEMQPSISLTSGVVTTSTYTFTVPSNASGMAVGFNLSRGTGLTGSSHTIFGVQLEAGSLATPFEQRPYGMELALCQRYFCKSYAYGTTPGTATIVGCKGVGGTGVPGIGELITLTYPVPMRTTPTIVQYSVATGASGCVRDVTAATDIPCVALNGNELGYPNIGIALTLSHAYNWHYTASAEL